MKQPAFPLADLERAGRSSLYPNRPKITVGLASCGKAAGAEEVFRFLQEEGERHGFAVAPTGCLGFCQQEPLVSVWVPGRPRHVYARVDREFAQGLLAALAAGELPRRRLLGRVFADEVLITGEVVRLGEPGEGDLFAHPFYKGQVKVATRNCGIINPFSIAEYVARGGYRALALALTKDPEEIIAEVRASGLRGRGGAGFPTGEKWRLTRAASGEVKYVICNADEGDPGAYMDRGLLEGDPHAVLEGMIIGGYAIGASLGIVYVRTEYPLAVATVRKAVAEAEAHGFLGENIGGTGFSFRIVVVEGRGAFVCGEETALIASLEGRAGEPRPRPPYPAERGLWGCPTCINNVETWANVPPIIVKGGAWFAGMGTPGSKGTKVFALVGDVRNTGLAEVPLGMSLRRVVSEIGGGTGVFALKAVQTGGPSGGCLPAHLLDLPVDYEALTQAGTIMGSGGLVVMDERACMVDVARYFLSFTQEESCGKCLPCRDGTRQMLLLLEKICAGRGEPSDLALLEELALTVKETSLCGLGQTAPNPVLSTLAHFREEYEAHVKDKFCPAGACRGLFALTIDASLCRGCGLCARVCPQGAIQGKKGEPHVLAVEKCVSCRACLNTCRARAVKVVPRGR